MPRSGTLTTAEKNSIKIDDFIFHIISKGQTKPTFLSSVQLEPSQTQFFCERIAESSEGTQYKFQDKSKDTAAHCDLILKNSSKNFLQASMDIAESFRKLHIGNVSDGAFIVARFHIETGGQDVPLIALIKLDHKKVIQYDVELVNGQNVAKMKEILNSFIESKAAVQKCAIVEPYAHFDWDVLANERGSSIGIADYFESFLSVVELKNPSFWTKKAVSTVNSWSRSINDLPESRRNYRARATQYMETHNAFDTDSFIDMVVLDNDLVRKAAHVQSLKNELVASGVAGQKFQPTPGSVKSYGQSTLVTKEGVSIKWSGTEKSANVDIKDKDKNGIITIVIKTQQLDDKSNK